MDLNAVLEKYGQTEVLRFFDELTKEEREELSRQLESVDFEVLSLPEEGKKACQERTEPIRAMSLEEIAARREEFAAEGRKLIARGGLAAVLLAGGQGTRLGFNAPKGMFDIGLTHPVYIFELLTKNLLSVAEACGDFPPFFIMTSEKNDAETRAFFEAHGYFGYPKERVRFFRQRMSPCVDLRGKLLLEGKGRLALSPDGNGGWFGALLQSEILKEFEKIEWFNVFSVDNVLQKIADPVFLGAALKSGADCAAKGVKKRDPKEKVGVLCLKDGLPAVIEYYELDEERANLRDEKGELVYSFGVTLNYLFRAERLGKIAKEKIPFHIVQKKIPCLNEAGELIEPEENNGYKFETLILDLVQKMGSCLPFEVDREREFAPVKNREGADSVDSARALLLKNGVKL